MKKEIGMYALAISTDEAYFDITNNQGLKMDVMVIAADAVYQDPEGRYQMLLYYTPKKRKEAYKKGKEMGLKTLASWTQLVYVDAKYLEGEKNE